MDDVGLSRRTPTGPTLRTPEVGGVGMEAQGGQLPVKIGRISIVFMNLAHFPWGPWGTWTILCLANLWNFHKNLAKFP